MLAPEDASGRDSTEVATDPHSPDEFRCNQVVRNLNEFYRAFGVKEDDALYLPPEERVCI
jgi:putative endopeptidase